MKSSFSAPAATGSMGSQQSGMAPKRRKRRVMMRRKRTLDPAMIIDYKQPEILRRFITDRGKIIPRRISGATQAQQRCITLAVKRARFLALLPSAVSHETERGFAGEMQAAAQATASTFRPRPSRPFSGEERAPGSGPKIHPVQKDTPPAS